MAGLLAAAASWTLWAKLGAFVRHAVQWLVADFWRLVAAALLCACTVLLIQRDGLHMGIIQIEGLKGRVQQAEAALRAAKNAQAKASAAQAAANHQPAQTSRAIAEASHVQSKSYYEQGHSAAAVYAAGNSVRGTCPEGGSGDAGLPRSDHPAGQHDSAGEPPDLVAVTRADFDQLTGNSLRLAQVREDAQALIAAGVAVPLEIDPPPDASGMQ